MRYEACRTRRIAVLILHADAIISYFSKRRNYDCLILNKTNYRSLLEGLNSCLSFYFCGRTAISLFGLYLKSLLIKSLSCLAFFRILVMTHKQKLKA
ncbi:hypothetical protein GCWU000325_02522 [Alloprevotella tannerae ATCC 51259]|uniref:Uncharacterized protein n=1 Tax=Alloprevotella tannerae ATCC 51259 TaxID=626522 RepID=C9LJV8_9BACT|nr:hypothetical protein GCWU000325_02522 [Alloprevotella tannerae ATCC 51259]